MIKNNDIISLECTVKLQYKNCEMTLKKIDRVYIINAVDITEKGYIIEISETFLGKKELYPNLLNFLNHVVDKDLYKVYKKLQNKKNLRDLLNNNK